MPTCKLDGVALTAHAPIRWGRVGGVAPYTTTVLTTKARAEKIFSQSKGKGVELEITQKDVRKVFKNIWVISMMAGDGPHTRRLLLADWRWLLPRIWITADGNLIRTSVERRLQGATPEISVLLPAQVYAPHSLDGSQPYTAYNFLNFVFGKMFKELTALGAQVEGTGGNEFPPSLPEIEVLNWRLDGPGDVAIQQLLDLMPGLQFEANEAGGCRFYFESALQEKAQVDGAFAYAEPGNQYPVYMDRERYRPIAINIFFEKRMELLFQFREGTTGSSTGSFINPGFDLINVVQVSEPVAVGTFSGGFGSWVPFEAYINYLATQPRPAHAQNDICRPSMDWVRRNFFSGFSAMRVLFRSGEGTDPLWAARFDTILNSYRQTFGVSQYWYDRLQGLEAVRSGVWSTSMNIHAPSEAYCDYTTRPTFRQIDTASGGHDANWAAVQADQYVYGRDISALRPAPFNVVVEDQDGLIIRLAPKAELSKLGQRPMPGVPVNPVACNAPRKLNSINSSLAQGLWEQMVMKPTWDMAVVLTATVATPNGTERYHKEIVIASEAQEVVKSVVIGPCSGPVIYMRCDPATLMAWSMWVGGSTNQIRAAVEGGNLTAPFFQNPEAVRDVAVAMAARVYESLCDRLSGERVRVSFKPETKPVGALNQVIHEVETTGRVSTSFSFAQAVEPRDLMVFLPANTRRIIQRIPSQIRGR